MLDKYISTPYEEVDVSVVKIKGGKLHINNNAKNGEFKYIWEEDGEYAVSHDGETWQQAITDFETRMDY